MNVLRKKAADDFEVKLANVADAEIAQRLPSLNDYKIGFQLIERDDEGTRGVGVMVYQVGEQWIYVPCFFLNGRIRGYDMMYLPERSQFVPAKDNWVTYLKSNRTTLLGKKTGDLRKSNPRRADSVSLRNSDSKSRSIMFKGASESPLLTEREVAGMLMQYNDYDRNVADLRTWIPRLGKHACVMFLKTLNNNPDFANAILTHYGPMDIQKIAEASKDETPAKDGTEVQDGTYSLTVEHTNNDHDLKIVTADDTEAVKKLDDTAKEVVLRDGLYVVDNRKNTSAVFIDKQESGSLTTPTKSGYYEVLLADGSFRKCYIIALPKTRTNYGRGINAGTVDVEPFSYKIVDLDRPNLAYSCDQPLLTRSIEAREATNINGIGIKPTTLLKKFNTVENAKDKPIAIGNDAGDDVKPYEWENCIVIDGKGNYQEFSLGASKTVIGNKIAGVRIASDTGCEGGPNGTIHLTGQPGEVCRKGNSLYIPEGARVVAHRRWCDETMPVGDLETIKNKIIKTAEWRALTVSNDGLHYALDGKFGRDRMLSKNAALVKLVTEHGIKAPDAKMMLNKTASVGRHVKHEYLVKYAEPTMDDEKTNIFYEEKEPYEENENMSPEISGREVDQVVDASEKGVKEVMDVSVLKALASNGSPSRMVEEYIQDLMLAMDRVGRILFMFYWHYNNFKDQYGQEKMTELEDSLRDNFQNLSDLTLFLHKSTTGNDGDLFADELTENFA